MAYGSGQAAEGIANYLLTTLLLFYYTSVLGLTGELAGLALLIGLQNRPEGFNAFREIKALEGGRPERAQWLMLALVPVGPLLGITGWQRLPNGP